MCARQSLDQVCRRCGGGKRDYLEGRWPSRPPREARAFLEGRWPSRPPREVRAFLEGRWPS